MTSISKYVIRDEHGNIIAQSGFSVVAGTNVGITPGHGVPYAESEYVDGILTIILHNVEGNGITEIVTDSQEGDEAINTITIKTNNNPEGVSFEVRNGSKGNTGNGIADITEERSEEDGGTNTIHILLDDGTELIVHTMNGHTGAQGATVHYDAATDIVLDTKTGDSEVMGMTQKAVTDYVDISVHKTKTDKTSSIIDGYYQTGNIGLFTC